MTWAEAFKAILAVLLTFALMAGMIGCIAVAVITARMGLWFYAPLCLFLAVLLGATSFKVLASI